ncbi:MAG: ABC transporter substrate-binding protein, partial [Gemmatimonadetes bacterium]|nr:ABC transporter substrate-binding protein [Gemmatimonadota bacterium]
LLLVATSACGPFPRDPEGTLEEVEGQLMRVGAAESPPTLRRSGDGAAGPEAELVESFARSLGARVEWSWIGTEEALHRLERFDLHLVAGGLTRGTPWKAHVGLSRPWRGQGDTARVLAVPPGENRFLVALDRHIESRP